MRLVPFVALLATVSGAYQLSGSLNTPGNEPLAGVTVSLAVAGASTVTATDGRWQLGGATGMGRSARTDLRVARHLSVGNGRIRLDWSGRDIAGRHGFTPSSTAMPGATAGRTAGTNDDTLVFTWRSARIGAIPVRLDSVYSLLQLRLDTLAVPSPRSVQVRAVRSAWAPMQGLSILLTSPGTILKLTDTIRRVGALEPVKVLQDSLTLRLFVRSKDTLAGTQYQSSNTGLVPVPLRFRNGISVRYDICQAYDSSGYNKPCDDRSTGRDWSWGTLSNAVGLLMPVRMEGSYDPLSGTSIYAIDAPLGPTILPVGGKVRLDILFGDRSEYGKPLSQGLKELSDSLIPYLPGRAMPSVGDMGWWDRYTGAPPHAFAAVDSAAQSLDWSFSVHAVRNGSPVDFLGIPKAASTSEVGALLEGSAKDLNPWTRVASNPYICVYRKGVLVSGYPPVVGRD